MPRALTPLLLLLCTVSCEPLETELDRVQAVFERYQERQAAHDPQLAELYADDASITWVTREDGERKETSMTGDEFKRAATDILDEARREGRRYTYLEVTIKKLVESGRQESSQLSLSAKDAPKRSAHILHTLGISSFYMALRRHAAAQDVPEELVEQLWEQLVEGSIEYEFAAWDGQRGES